MWRCINFAALVVLLWYLLADKIKKYFVDRKIEIGQELDEVEKERNSAKTTLIYNKIYPQILWEIEKYVPKKYSYAHDLSRKILMIPIDQRYDSNDLSKVTKILNRHYS
jgi:hypothetical protein